MGDACSRLCADCGKGDLERNLVEDELHYGAAPDGPVLLEYTVPIWTCKDCGYQFMDVEAEQIRTDRVNAYLYAIGKGLPKEWSPKWRHP